MQYGLCHLSIVPVKLLADDASELLTQLLYGDHFKILEQRKKWSKIRIAFDSCEGWILNNQFTDITEDNFRAIEKSEDLKFSSDLVSFVSTGNGRLIPILLGSSVQHAEVVSHFYEGECSAGSGLKSDLVNTALLYLNAPYLWGGKTPFGIDCSGLAQMVYKINGYKLLRSALEQATQGEALSFIEESDEGDLAFFDNQEGIIDHVGIIMKNNYIIHTHGKVRIDRLDQTGIFNTENKTYSHKLRVIKKIV